MNALRLGWSFWAGIASTVAIAAGYAVALSLGPLTQFAAVMFAASFFTMGVAVTIAHGTWMMRVRQAKFAEMREAHDALERDENGERIHMRQVQYPDGEWSREVE